jgi:hypothetical protein
MMFRGHNSITVAGRATRLRGEWPLCLPVSFELNACPNTPSHLGMHLNGFNSIGSAKSTEQQVDYRQSMR